MPNDYTTLLSGSYWSGAEITGMPVVLTYSFLATKPTRDPHLLGAALDTFQSFTTPQQILAQQALARWSAVSGVVFEQVAPGKGDINFAAYNLGGSGASQGYFPWGNWDFSTATYTGPQNTLTAIHFGADTQAAGGGDVLMNTVGEDPNGQFSYATLLHEIGHALGLKHPTESWTTLVAHNQWDDNIAPYSGDFSIMTPSGIPSTLTDLTSNDVSAVDAIYGTADQQWAQFASHSWNGTTYTLTGTLKNGGQTVRGASVSNTITGGTGADTVYAIGQGTNRIYGRRGDDTLVGGSGVNYLDGGAGADTLNGNFSVNSYASYADARSTGGAGVTVDLLHTWLNRGDASGDAYLNIHKVQGSNFDDTIVGDDAGDTLNGGAGADTITGGTGRDMLIGGVGADALTGGSGADQFRYLAPGEGGDTITDFKAAEGDRIMVSAAGFHGGLIAGPLGLAQFTSGATSGMSGQFVWNASAQTLSWDSDGAGAANATLVATLLGVSTLTATAIKIL